MSARDRVRRARITLVAATLVSAVLWGTVAGLALMALAGAIDVGVDLPVAARAAWPAAARVVGAVVALAWVLRGARTASLAAVALWIEERVPTLRYALVTVLDPVGSSYAAQLEGTVAASSWAPVIRRAVVRAVATPATLVLVATAAFAVLPRGAIARVARAHVGDALDRSATATGNALASVVVTVVPPAYTGLPRDVRDDASTVVAVVGSAVSIEGRAVGGPVSAVQGALPLAVTGAHDRWRADLPMPAEPVVIRLRHNGRERLLLLEPRPDSAPVVLLAAPARDTVFRSPSGTLPLVAELHDDFGLTASWFELVISSGEGENFKFRTVVLDRAALANAHAATRRLALVLDSLALHPGDLVHVRAVARDGNSIAGPATGASDTRTLRIARAGEYDSVAVEGAPPSDPLNGVLSERMLIMLAEVLENRRPRLVRREVVQESQRIGDDQTALRKLVGKVIFQRLEGEDADDPVKARDLSRMTPEQLLKAADDATGAAAGEALDFGGGESPVVAINRPLLEAYNAMWDAERDLQVGEPKRALPHMYAALSAIQRARQAERIYLRGRPATVVVDIAKVRLAGKRDGVAPAARTPRTADDAATARRAARFDAAFERLVADQPGAVDSLLVLRSELLTDAPRVAAPLGLAIDALRRGRDATAPLVQARRALLGASEARVGLSAWGGQP